MKWPWLILLLVIAAAAVGGYFYFDLGKPLVRYENDDVYLLRYASVTAPSGVFGYPPGTKLTLHPLRRGTTPGRVCVFDGTREFEVEPDALTRNPAIAKTAADADRQMQAQAVAGVAAAKAHVTKVETEAQLARARDVERINAARRAGAPVVLPPPAATPGPHGVLPPPHR